MCPVDEILNVASDKFGLSVDQCRYQCGWLCQHKGYIKGRLTGGQFSITEKGRNAAADLCSTLEGTTGWAPGDPEDPAGGSS